MKRLFGRTWLGWLNIIILQWLFIRLARVVDKDGNTESYCILKYVWPTTGWKNDYKYLFKK